MKTFWLAIVGSRTFTDRHQGFTLIDQVVTRIERVYGRGEVDLRIVSGGAIGADTIAKAWADMAGIECLEIRPDYGRYGSPAAQFVRNKAIVERADAVLALWDGRSSGTRDTIRTSRQLRKPTCVLRADTK